MLANADGKEPEMLLTKEKVIELIKSLPDDITVDDIMEELYFKSQVDEGLAQLDRGEGIPHEDVFRKVWDNQEDAAYDKL